MRLQDTFQNKYSVLDPVLYSDNRISWFHTVVELITLYNIIISSKITRISSCCMYLYLISGLRATLEATSLSRNWGHVKSTCNRSKIIYIKTFTWDNVWK